MRTPLDLVYAGWKCREFEKLNSSDWVINLAERLEVMRDVAAEKSKTESVTRKEYYDVGKKKRKLCVGDKVWCRIPGRNGKLDDAWDGPYEVDRILCDINYCVKEVGSKKRGKTVHKKFVERCDVTKIVVEEGAKPRAQKPYRIPDMLKPKVEAAVKQLVEEGWVEETVSLWGAPIVPVHKTDGSIRLCIDYRNLNNVTPQIHFQIPLLEEMLGKVGKATHLSKLDLEKRYYQIPLDEDSRDMTAFVSPWGCYRFKVLPFGLKNAPGMFQSIMTKILKECLDCSVVYIDDVLVYSDSVEEHKRDVRKVLCALREAGLTAKRKKCEWGLRHVEYLGHKIGNGQLAVPAHRIAAMRDYRKPKTKKDMRAFLGSAGYYRRFVKNFAESSTVLTPATLSKAPGKVIWTPEMDEAFAKLCVSLCDMCVLHVPSHSDQFILHTDTSGRGIGGILNVQRDDGILPVAFYSRQLRGAVLSN